MTKLRADMEQAKLAQQHAEERKKELEELIEELRNHVDLQVSQLNETCSEEMAEMRTELTTLKTDKVKSHSRF